jgi:hypothetical protein
MSKTAKTVLVIIVIIVMANAGFIFYKDFISSSSTISLAPQSTLQVLSQDTTSITISSTTEQELLATTTPQTKTTPVKTIIAKPISTPTTTSVTPNLPVAVDAPTTTPPSTIITNQDSDPATITINPQTIVGILCYYNATYTDEQTGQSVYAADDEEVRGSGVIINNRGDILTNRHIVVQPDTDTTIDDQNGNSVPVTVNYELDHCDVGQIPAGDTLPTASQIEAYNPYIQLPVLGYTAQPVYISQTSGLTPEEIQYADFAVLQITGISSSGPTFGVNAVPNSFPYVTLLPVGNYPDVLDAQVITYGFPGDVTSGQGNFFQTLTMTGSVGSVTSVETGDQFYSTTPLLLNTNLAIAHGRSGSPLFWRGYDIGIVTFFIGDDQSDSGSVASDAILKALKGTGYILGD